MPLHSLTDAQLLAIVHRHGIELNGSILQQWLALPDRPRFVMDLAKVLRDLTLIEHMFD